jgi:transposase
VFSQGKKKEQASADTARLYEQIGRLQVEVDFLKKRV